MKFNYNDGGRTKHYPKKKLGDCVVRAISIALEQDYKKTLIELCDLAIEKGGMPNSHHIYEIYLGDRGWIKNKPPRDSNGKKIRLKDWEHNRAIVLTTGHLTCVIDNCINDTFYTGDWCCNSYFTPITNLT